MHTANAISTESPKVFFKDGRLVTTSQSIADYFDKQHKHILAKIDALDCSPEFTSANFSADVQTIGIGNGAERETRCFLITKDGFMFLVMGFTGKKAARLKEAYIAKFNHMESELQSNSASQKKSVQIAPPGRYQLLLTMEGTQVVDTELVAPGKMLIFIADMPELMMRAGYVVMPFSEVGKVSMDEWRELADRTRRISEQWRKDSSKLAVSADFLRNT
ncbi:TPA: Rha family transcriptional regulator [Citrobacter gillenii]